MLASDQRAGRWARGKARREQYDFVRRNWRRLVSVAVVPLLVASVGAWFLPPFAGGMLIGLTVAAVFGLSAFYVVQATGTAQTMAGDEAEQWTAQQLRPLTRQGWRLVNHFNLSDRGDIDHVLVGPPGVLAVETRWSAEPWVYDELSDRRLTDKVSQARDNARRLEMWQPFQARGIQVRPIVMLWGRGLSDWPDGTHGVSVDGVQVVSGARAKLWRRSLPKQAVLNRLQIDELWAAIDRQAEMRDEHDNALWPVPASPMAFYMRALLALTGFTAGVLVAGRLLQPPTWAAFWACMALLLAGGLGLRARGIKFAARGWVAGVTAMLLTAAIGLTLVWAAAL